jgi:poly(A) polymerase
MTPSDCTDDDDFMAAPLTPVRFLEPLGPMTGTAARRVLQSLMRTGQEARFVGGCVRDALLGVEGADIDIATPLPPDEVMRRLKQDGMRVIPTGLKHGTVTAIVELVPFEITTLRKDVDTDGRHATVAFTTDWGQDAARRDFTFNAMSLSPEGELHDLFNGQADLLAGRVRFVGEAANRIREDRLRLLRFFRFHARFGRGDPDPDTLEACAAAAPQLNALSGERVRDEILKLLCLDRAVSTWRVMLERGIVQHLLPQATNINRLAALDRLEWLVGETEPLARLAALLPAGEQGVGERGAGERAAAEVAERLRLSGAQRDQLLMLCDPPIPVHPDLPQKQRRVALQKLGPEITRALLMLAAAESGTPTVELLEPLAEAASWTIIPFPLQGQDVLDRGIAAGPEVGRLLAEVEAWWTFRDYRPHRDDCLLELDRRVRG